MQIQLLQIGVITLNVVFNQLYLDLIFERFSLRNLFNIEDNRIPGKWAFASQKESSATCAHGR